MGARLTNRERGEFIHISVMGFVGTFEPLVQGWLHIAFPALFYQYLWQPIRLA